MRKLWIVALLLMVTIVPAQAQENTWQAYLFSENAREILRVDQNGAAEVFSLGVTDERHFINSGISVSNDGRLAAFCVIDVDAVPQTYTFIIRDIEAQTNLVEKNEGDIAACRVGAFNADNTQVAVGQVYINEEGMAFTEGAPLPDWRLALIDTASGEVVHALTQDSPDAPSIIFYDRPASILPAPNHFGESRVYFKALPYIPTEFLDVEGFVWDFTTGDVTAFPAYGIYNSDFSTTTGEVLYPALDESRPNVTPMGIVPPANVARLQSGVDGAPQDVYFTGEWGISRVQFLNDGQRFLIHLLPSAETPLAEISGFHFAVVEHDGTSTQMTLNANYASFGSSAQATLLVWQDFQNQNVAPFVTRVGVLEGDTLTEVYRRQDEGNEPRYWSLVRVVS